MCIHHTDRISPRNAWAAWTLVALAASLLALTSWPHPSIFAAEPEEIEITLHPRRAESSQSIRLLPADPELRDGDAAVVMLRIIWEQRAYMETVVPQFEGLMELPYDDPKIEKTIAFQRFYEQLHRAAYIREAHWNYPLREEPLAYILLPDVQGFRMFVGRGLSLWVGTKIAKGELEEAREGILTQFACARHLARTPFVVNQLVANNIAASAFEKIELLMGHRQSPNLYWALGQLPDAIGNPRSTVQWEARMLPGSLTTLDTEMAMDDEGWKEVAFEFSQFMQLQSPNAIPAGEAESLKKRLLIAARRYLQDEQGFTSEQLDGFVPEAIVMRWILAIHDNIYAEIEAAYGLPPQVALARLVELDARQEQLLKEVRSPVSSFPRNSAKIYLALQRFQRHAKLLQAVEAIRDHVASSDGKLPDSLDDVKLFVPNDPLTAEPFPYERDGDVATIGWTILNDLPAKEQVKRTYRLRVAAP